MAGRRRSVALLAVFCGFAVAAAGCGSKDFANNPRVPNTFQVTAYVDDSVVKISPNSFGAGIAAFSIANQSHDDIHFTVDGPTKASTEVIPAGGTGNLKTDLKEGDYLVSGGPSSVAQAASLTIGPERVSAQNKLLLP